MDIKQLLHNAMNWAVEAGKIQLEYFRGNDIDIQFKFNASDIVTIADKKSEVCIINHIKTTYPSHSILSEESGEEVHNDEFCWVIDPLDGTTNFSQGLPLFAVSIGIKRKGETIAGVVYAPYLNEMFHAIKGNGAYLNGKRLSASTKTKLAHAVVATGFPVDKDTNPDNNLDNFSRIAPQVRGVRRFGAAAIDLCYVAAGNLDAYWEMNLHEWDICAGKLIAEEAGAIIGDFRTDRNFSILAAPAQLYKFLMPLLSKH